MVQAHATTPVSRIQVVGQLIGHQGEYGAVTRLSRQQGVSRQTPYHWRSRGQQALAQVFAPAPTPPVAGQERAILTFLVAGHASERGIQECLAAVGQPVPSLGTISRVVQEACRRALLAVYHNHRVAPRGVHQDTSPLQRSGLAAPADWLTALGYPPAAAAMPRYRTTPAEVPMAA